MSTPKVITLMSTKGGAGKSTAIRIAASQLAFEGNNVLIADADVQGSCVRWLENAKKRDNPIKNLHAVEIPSTDVGFAKLENIRELGGSFEYIFIDLQGAANIISSPTTRVSDLVIFPMQVAQDDFDSFKSTHKDFKEICDKAGRNIPAVLSLNRYDAVKHRSNMLVKSRFDIAERLGLKAMNTLIRERNHYADMLMSWGSIPQQNTDEFKKTIATSIKKSQRECYVYANEIKAFLNQEHDETALMEGAE